MKPKYSLGYLNADSIQHLPTSPSIFLMQKLPTCAQLHIRQYLWWPHKLQVKHHRDILLDKLSFTAHMQTDFTFVHSTVIRVIYS